MAKLIEQKKEENMNLTKTKLISKITKVTCARNQYLYIFFSFVLIFLIPVLIRLVVQIKMTLLLKIH